VEASDAPCARNVQLDPLPDRRFARIYVVYVPALVMTALVFAIGLAVLSDRGSIFVVRFLRCPVDFGGGRQALCHAAGLQGFACAAWKQNPPLWSLGYEWALYLVAPILLGLLASRGTLVDESPD